MRVILVNQAGYLGSMCRLAYLVHRIFIYLIFNGFYKDKNDEDVENQPRMDPFSPDKRWTNKNRWKDKLLKERKDIEVKGNEKEEGEKERSLGKEFV